MSRAGADVLGVEKGSGKTFLTGAKAKEAAKEIPCH